MTFQSIGDFVRKEQQLTVQLESKQFWSSLVKMTRHHIFFICFNFFPTVIPSVYTERIFPSVKSLENLPTKIFSRYFRLYLLIFW
jgi:hypothetical protein